MPFVRFTRDRRGYENTYVLHTYRERGRTRSRILYWFRTPPGVKVGRAPLDEEAIRTLEARNPDLHFDWNRILKVQAPATSERGRELFRGREAPRRPPGSAVTTMASAPAAARALDERLSAAAEETPNEERGGELPADVSPAPTQAVETELAVPEVGPEVLPSGAGAVHPVAALVGEEGLAVLRARYAELLARISERVADPACREALRRLASGLDPDTWVTRQEAERGIDSFEQRYAALRAEIHRRRRRGGRAGRGGAPSGSAAPAETR